MNLREFLEGRHCLGYYMYFPTIERTFEKGLVEYKTRVGKLEVAGTGSPWELYEINLRLRRPGRVCYSS